MPELHDKFHELGFSVILSHNEETGEGPERWLSGQRCLFHNPSELSLSLETHIKLEEEEK